MLKLEGWLQRLDGRRVAKGIQINVKAYNNVDAVYVKADCDCALDPECGVVLTISGIEHLESYMADFRHSEYWCKPFFGSDLRLIPHETQMLIWKEADGNYGVMIPVVSEQYKCVLEGGDDGLCAKLFSWYSRLNQCDALAFVTARGENPFELLQQCVCAALKLLNNNCLPFAERHYPEIFDYLGWSTWDAFNIRVNERSVLEKAAEFSEKGIPVRWFLFDDMWGEVREFYNKEYSNFDELLLLLRSGTLYSFEADPRRFPDGLKHCIDALKDLGIQVGLWQACTGYWKGITPESELHKKYRDIFFHASSGEILHAPQYEKAFRFYDAYHQFLQDSGAAFLKIDNQSMFRRYYKELAPIGETARNVHAAIDSSAARHFGNQVINCMGHASECMWNRPISPLCRCSDDFLPEDRSWFRKHLLQCAYNSLFIGQFMYTDWDMWWTDDSQAQKNSLLRAVSGGPVYVSDTVGRSRADILKPLILSDGKILRCDRPAMPAKDCITENPERSGKIFKLQNICGDTGILAVFNLDRSEAPVHGVICPKDVEGLAGKRFAVYEHFSRRLELLKDSQYLPLSLVDSDDFRLYIIVPLEDNFAPIGLADKFISPKTFRRIDGTTFEIFESGEFVYVKDDTLHFKQIICPPGETVTITV